MTKLNKIIIQLIFALIIILVIDNGKTFVAISSNLQNLICLKHNSDLDMPDCDNSNRINDIDNWIISGSPETTFPVITGTCFTGIHSMSVRDFSTSVWQPPKSV
jgi:hypothetical protein